MSSRWRAACLAGLFSGCAAVLFVGCSDDSSQKKTGNPVAEAGEAGAAGEPAAGTGGVAPTPEGGAAGETPAGAGEGGAAVVGAAGEGGATVIGAAGAGGAVTEGGAAGAGPLGCQPTGVETGISLSTSNPQKVCRGAIVNMQFSATTADDSFTCCGLSNNTVPFAVDIQGVTQGKEGDYYGYVALRVPTDAPLGLASIGATCSGGRATNTFDIEVTTTPIPLVTGLEKTQIAAGDTLQVNGSGLELITRITAQSVDGSNGSSECLITTNTQTTGSVSCVFVDGISPGNYYIVAEATDCGAALAQPVVTITQPPT